MILYIEMGPAEENYRFRLHEHRPLRDDLMSYASELRMLEMPESVARMMLRQQAAWYATVGVVEELFDEGKDAGL